MLARNSEEVERARSLAGFLAAPRAVRPGNEVRMLGLAADFVGEFLRDADFIRSPVVNGALLTEGFAERGEEADGGVLGFSIKPLSVP